MHNQAIVNLFGGHTPLCLSFDPAQDHTIQHLKQRIHDETRLDTVDQRISSMGGRPLPDDHVLFNESATVIVNVSLGLLGGKGGFGSMLRAQGGRMNAQKTTNFEACRDLQGRRIRTVNETKKLQEELDALPEREMEKREKLKKKIEEGLKGIEQKKYRFDDTQFLEDREQMVENVKSAVGSLFKQQQKKKVAAVSVSMFDDDEDEEDDDEPVDADNEEPPAKKQKQTSSSSSTTTKKDKGKGKATSTEKSAGDAAGNDSDDDQDDDSKKVLSEFLETNYDEYDSEEDEDFEGGAESSEDEDEEEELEEDFEAEEEEEDDTPKVTASSSKGKGKGKQTGKRKQRDE